MTKLEIRKKRRLTNYSYYQKLNFSTEGREGCIIDLIEAINDLGITKGDVYDFIYASVVAEMKPTPLEQDDDEFVAQLMNAVEVEYRNTINTLGGSFKSITTKTIDTWLEITGLRIRFN